LPRRWLALGVAAVAVVGIAVLMSPPYEPLRASVAQLGPVAGWRCAETATYVYDPRHGQPDETLLDEPPETTLQSSYPDLEIQRIEVNLRSGETVAWTLQPSGVQRVFVLDPGRLRTVGLNRAGAFVPICDSHLGDWQIIADHTL
jgi:hypothetical protein